MHFQMTAAVAYAILSFTPTVSGHCIIIDAYGDKAGSPHCMGLGAVASTPRNGVTQPGFQEDTTVFASPAVPWTRPKCQGYQPTKKLTCCKAGNCWPKTYYTAVKRTPLNAGCGVTLGRIKSWAKQAHPVQYAQPWNQNTFKNVYYYQQPVAASAQIDINAEILQRANSLPLVTAGGYIQMKLHQVNSDGAGPFHCMLDEAANGQSWGRALKVTTNVPGNSYSINKYQLKKWPIVVQLPADLNCQGSYGGHNKICLMRCQNKAKNGPFGGCVPFQQWTPPAPEPEPSGEPTVEPTPVPEPTPPSYNNDDEYTPVPDNYQDGSEWTDPGNSYNKRGAFNQTLFDRYVASELDEEGVEEEPKLRFMRD
ncbi:hypothetical protein TWF694_006136 [Orbilia ellipsospora]|uniref:Uncharacterized protein n=1 Tax=Orbilia ellipsospora TaxID=2528407 RepID=A0AAV9WXF6_9PEZI